MLLIQTARQASWHWCSSTATAELLSNSLLAVYLSESRSPPRKRWTARSNWPVECNGCIQSGCFIVIWLLATSFCTRTRQQAPSSSKSVLHANVLCVKLIVGDYGMGKHVGASGQAINMYK